VYKIGSKAERPPAAVADARALLQDSRELAKLASLEQQLASGPTPHISATTRAGIPAAQTLSRSSEPEQPSSELYSQRFLGDLRDRAGASHGQSSPLRVLRPASFSSPRLVLLAIWIVRPLFARALHGLVCSPLQLGLLADG